MATNVTTLAGLLIVLVAFLTYFAMLFVLNRFTYRTWVFHAAVLLGMALAAIGALLGGSQLLALFVLLLGATWFIVTRRELAIRGSHTLKVRVGDSMPAFRAMTTDGAIVTEHELAGAAPILLVLYRGWWCPSSKVQLDDIRGHYAALSALGVKVFAGSVDQPEESAPMQEYVGLVRPTLVWRQEPTNCHACGYCAWAERPDYIRRAVHARR
jgi:hypothetical protein